MKEGWIKIHREIIEHWIFSNPLYLRAWVFMLFRANWKPTKVLVGSNIVNLDRGEFITSIQNFADDTGMSFQSTRTFFDLLENEKMIDRKSTNTSTRITILNYDRYQVDQQTSNKPATNEQQTNNKRATTEEEYKEGKERKEEKENFIKEKGPVLMKNSGVTIQDISEAFQKTKDLTQADPEYYFNQVLDWSTNRGKMGKDWIAAIRSWARRDLADGKLKNLPYKHPKLN